MTKEEVKQRVCEAIVAAQPRLREIAESIMAEPELGYKEVKTLVHSVDYLGVLFLLH